MLLLVCALVVGFIPAGKAKAATYQPDGSFYDSPLCLPALYANPPDDCLPLGASQTLRRLATEGIRTF